MELQRANTQPQALSSESAKRLYHNANERNRRKKLNELFWRLQALHPGLHPQIKMNVPTVLDRILEYIPELVAEIEALKARREQLLYGQNPNIQYVDGSQAYSGKAMPLVSLQERPLQQKLMLNMYLPLPFAKRLRLSKLLLLLRSYSLEVVYGTHFVTGSGVCYYLHLQKEQEQMYVQTIIDVRVLQQQLLLLVSNVAAPKFGRLMML